MSIKTGCKATLSISGKPYLTETSVSKIMDRGDYDLLLNNGMKFYFKSKNDKRTLEAGVEYLGKVKYMEYGIVTMDDCNIKFCECTDEVDTRTGKKKDCGCK